MNAKKVSAGEFMQKYGGRVPVSRNDEITVFEGATIDSVNDYLGSMGFSDISGFDGFLGGTRGAVLTMSRDTTDYAQKLFGDSFIGNIASMLFGFGIESLYKKSVGTFFPMAGREHARIYDLGDGSIAVLKHKDLGIEHYTSKGFRGLIEAALYHFDILSSKMEEIYA